MPCSDCHVISSARVSAGRLPKVAQAEINSVPIKTATRMGGSQTRDLFYRGNTAMELGLTAMRSDAYAKDDCIAACRIAASSMPGAW